MQFSSLETGITVLAVLFFPVLVSVMMRTFFKCQSFTVYLKNNPWSEAGKSPINWQAQMVNN